jgi:hypothetical protein
MWRKGIYKLLAISIVLAIVASSVVVFSAADLEEAVDEEGIDESGGNGVIALAPPSFISAASASGGGGAFPEDGAGIAAYIFTNQTISINKIKTIFYYVDKVGDNYIIGRTSIPNFGGDINVRVYADTDGWLVAYLPMTEPTAEIMKWETTNKNTPNFGPITTTLEDALIKAGNAADVGVNTNEIKYYDFEFPNANHMMIFVRTEPIDGFHRLQVEIPEDYMLFEASYYHYVYYCSKFTRYVGSKYVGEHTYWDSKLNVDGVTISDASTAYTGEESGEGNVYSWWRGFDSYKGAITTGTLHYIQIYYYPRERDGKGVSSAIDAGSAGVATVLIYRTA